MTLNSKTIKDPASEMLYVTPFMKIVQKKLIVFVRESWGTSSRIVHFVSIQMRFSISAQAHQQQHIGRTLNSLNVGYLLFSCFWIHCLNRPNLANSLRNKSTVYFQEWKVIFIKETNNTHLSLNWHFAAESFIVFAAKWQFYLQLLEDTTTKTVVTVSWYDNFLIFIVCFLYALQLPFLKFIFTSCPQWFCI